MISKTMNDALNLQVTKELFSSHLYLAMSAWLAKEGFPGFSIWMREQAMEEYEHAMRIFDYILERGGTIELDSIARPETPWTTVREIAEEVVAHEAAVTQMINERMDVAIAERDHAAQIFLQWFITEQVEEEASVGEVLDRVKLTDGDNAALYHLDMELAKRASVEEEDE